jgi:ADP-ribose pyrophosphatase YjhB (NUDIX family)
MEKNEAVFVFPVEYDEKYGYFVLLGERLEEGSAKGKCVPPMGKREKIKILGIKTPFKESWKRAAKRELNEETNRALKIKSVEYVGNITDKTYEPNTEWHIKVYAAFVWKIKHPMKSNNELKIDNDWYGIGCEDSLRKNNLMNETTCKALKMVSAYLKDKNNNFN